MQKTVNKQKRRSGKWLFFILLVIVLALLLAYFGRFSLGNGNGKDSGNPSAEKTVAEESKKQENSSSIEVTVKAEKIYWQTEEVSFDTFKTKLSDLEKGKVIIQLVDDGATLGTYEELEKALAESGHTFTRIDKIKK